MKTTAKRKTKKTKYNLKKVVLVLFVLTLIIPTGSLVIKMLPGLFMWLLNQILVLLTVITCGIFTFVEVLNELFFGGYKFI